MLNSSQILRQLEEIEININSHKDDDNYDISDLYTEREELQELLDNGDYLDCPELDYKESN